MSAIEWFIQKILVGKYLPHYKKNLKNIPLELNIMVEKTIQYPA